MNRRIDLDTITGILIVYMIIVHILGTSHTPQTNWHLLLRPLNFFMAWFFFKSGMFHKTNVNGKQMLTAGGGKKLLFVYVSFSVVALLLYWIELVSKEESNVAKYLISPVYQVVALGAITSNLPLWFLVSLLSVKTISAAIINRFRLGLTTTIVLSLLVALGLDYTNFHLTVWVGNISLGLFFYCSGYLLKTLQYKKSLFAISLIAFVVLHLCDYSNVDFRANRCTYGHYVSYILIAISGCIVINNLFRKCRQNIFSVIGRDSMSYYVCHFMILDVVGIVFNFMGANSHNSEGLIARACACLVLLPITNRIYKNCFIPFQSRFVEK